MRLYLRLTNNTEVIPFDYQHLLTGAVHKWIGKDNKEHGTTSLYSFSWLQNTRSNKTGLWLTRDSYFFVSAFGDELIKTIVKGIMEDSRLCCGSVVQDVQIAQTPIFDSENKFFLSSPIFIKRKIGNRVKHFLYEDEESNDCMTQTLKRKMTIAGIDSTGVSVKFDKTYQNPHTKLVNYQGINNRANMCPVIVKGTIEQIAFAWNVGIGNSTGIGFGALK